jgi:dipeptidyl-peptidase-3
MSASIDSELLKQYLADSPPTVVPLAIKPHFEALTDREKLYAHHVSV